MCSSICSIYLAAFCFEDQLKVQIEIYTWAGLVRSGHEVTSITHLHYRPHYALLYGRSNRR